MAQSAATQNPAADEETERKEDGQGAEPTSLTLVDGQAPPLSLTALHSALTARHVEMPYSSLSQFVALGDIAEQLGVGGKGNRREFPRWSVDFLADFLPWYQASKINKELAPDAMRHRLTQFRGSQNSIIRSDSSATTQISSSQNSKTSNPKTSTDMTFYEASQPADIAGPVARFLGSLLSPLTRLPAAMDNVADAIRELRGDRSVASPPVAPMPDRLLTPEEAATLLACKPRSVGRHVLPVSESPRRYRESDVLRHIQDLAPIEKTLSSK